MALDSVFNPRDLPPKWSMRKAGSGGRREFRSPDGVVFGGMGEVVSFLFGQNVALGPRRRRRSFSGTEPRRGETAAAAAAAVTNGPSEGGGGDGAEESEDCGDRGWFMDAVDRCRFARREMVDRAAGNLDGCVTYLEDGSLPPKWVVKVERSRVLYVAPKADLAPFRSRWEAAQYLEPNGHPATELEVLLGKAVVKCRERRDRILQKRYGWEALFSQLQGMWCMTFELEDSETKSTACFTFSG